ncbi:putative ribonuclease H-like domain-containing protein [Tanacetum coccineum]
MRPFGCHVTILNTLDYLGKFHGKSDEGFFVGYSMNSKAFRVYNIRTRKVEENLYIRFLEDKPIIAGDGPKWLFDIDVLTKSMNYMSVVAGTNSKDLVGTEESIGADHSSKETRSSQDCIFMLLWKDGVNKESGIDDQERPENSTQDVNIAGLSINTACTNVNTGSLNTITVSPAVSTAPLEATHVDFFGDETEIDMSNITTIYLVPSTPNIRIHKDHSLDHVIGDVQSSVLTRRMKKTINEQGFISVVDEGKTHKDLHTCLFACFLSQEEPKKVWTLVDLPLGKRAIGTKWVYKNKKDERGNMIRNKARLVAQGYTQEEGIDYDEVFAPIARIRAIRLFLAYALFKDFVVYQMDVKSEFLYGKIEEEVYVYQPPGFEDPEFPKRVYKVEKAYYGLHQAPRSCFFLGLQVTQKDDGIFINQDKYVDEILKKFGFSTIKTASTPMETSKPLLKDAEAKDVDVHLYRSMIGSLMYLTSSRPDIMFVVCACARFQVTPKVSHLHVVKRFFRILEGQPKLSLWYPKDSPFDLEAYTDSDYAGASLDRKSTTGAEYVAASSCCGQVLWIQNQLLDYGYNFMNTKIFIDNESTICIVKNPVFHSKTKHIEIRHHFIRDSYEKRLIQVIKIHTDHNVADLLTKAFDINDYNGLEMLRMELRLKLVTQKVNAVGLYLVLLAEKLVLPDETVHEERGDSMERAATTAAILDAEQYSGNIISTQSIATLNEPIPYGTGSGSGPRRQDTILRDRPAQTRFERLSKQFNDPSLSGDLEITSLKKRVKKLEKKKKARTPQLKRRLFKVRIESSDQEDASKQGRNEDQDEDISWFQEDAETRGRYDQDIDVTTASAPITTAGVSVSTAEPSTPPTTTTVIEDEDLIIAQTLMKMRSEKSKEKAKERGSKEKSSEPATRPTRGVTMQEPSKSGTRKAVPPSQHDLKD